MPYYYMPTPMERIFNWFHLQRWCFKCQGWVWLVHVHRHRPESGGWTRLDS